MRMLATLAPSSGLSRAAEQEQGHPRRSALALLRRNAASTRGYQAAFKVVTRRASLIAASLLLSVCGDGNNPLRTFCSQIASDDDLEICINDRAVRQQLIEKRSVERAHQRLQIAAGYDIRDLESSLTTEITDRARRVELSALPDTLTLESAADEEPARGHMYVVYGEIWVSRPTEEGEPEYIWIGSIGETTSKRTHWFAENRLLSPRQLETLDAACAFLGDSEYPICVGDIFVEIVPDAIFGAEPAVRGAKLLRPTYDDYYRNELSHLEEWLAQVESGRGRSDAASREPSEGRR